MPQYIVWEEVPGEDGRGSYVPHPFDWKPDAIQYLCDRTRERACDPETFVLTESIPLLVMDARAAEISGQLVSLHRATGYVTLSALPRAPGS